MHLKSVFFRHELSPHDISDRAWEIVSPHLPGKKGDWGGIVKDNRLFINAVVWILRTGAPWRDLPSEFGDWKNTHRRFCRWRDKGIWERLLDFVDSLEADGIEVVIPPRKNRKLQRIHDKHLYKIRHRVENAIQQLKEGRGVATRYAKRASSFLEIVQIRCGFQWPRFYGHEIIHSAQHM